MKKLTQKEEEVMQLFWLNKAMFVKELKEIHPDQKLHYNTLSTVVRTLEEKGFLAHESFGKTHRYFAVITEPAYRKGTIGNVVQKYFDNSYRTVVSMFVEEKNLSLDDLKKLIKEIENKKEE